MSERTGCFWIVVILIGLVGSCIIGFEKKDVYITEPDGTITMYTVNNVDITTCNWGNTTEILLPNGKGVISVPTDSVRIKCHQEVK